MKFNRHVAAFLMIVLALGSGWAGADEPPQTQPATVAEAVNRFMLDLLGQLPQEGNLFLSPYSIQTALAMTAAGAKGKTLEQMDKAMDVSDLPGGQVDELLGGLSRKLQTAPTDNSYELRIANSLWGEKSFEFLPAFLEGLKKDFGAGLTPVDFGDSEAARTTINDWVAKQTSDKIKDLIAPGVLNGGTRLVLANAIYFKGDWETPFKAEATASAPFHVSLDPKVATMDVAMMNQTKPLGYAENQTWQALEMPYKGGMSMVVLLPRVNSELGDLVKALDEPSLEEIVGRIKSQRVQVSFPKFTMEIETPVMDALGRLGISDAFSAQAADFSGMDGKHDLFISAVIHKAYVKVDEKGSEAAAATAIGVSMSAMPEEAPAPVFNADHPFLFMIRDTNTGAILFIGEVRQPDKFGGKS